MIVRHYTDSDFAEVKALHQRQGLEYELPDLAAPSMLVRAVIEQDGLVTDAAFLRKTSEAYWIFDPSETKRERLGKLLILSKEMSAMAKRVGLEDVHAWIPPAIIDKSFDLTMLHLGWVKPEWTCYSRRVE